MIALRKQFDGFFGLKHHHTQIFLIEHSNAIAIVGATNHQLIAILANFSNEAVDYSSVIVRKEWRLLLNSLDEKWSGESHHGTKILDDVLPPFGCMVYQKI